jgi:anti-sigma-K factor RskA
MNLRQLRGNPRLLDKLAGEYVLGTLRGGARRRFERWLEQDAMLRQAVQEWRNRLTPLAEFAPAVSPPPHLWRQIEQRLDIKTQERRPGHTGFRQRLRSDLRFWQGLGLASTAAAAILLAVLVMREPSMETAAPAYLAALADDRAQVAMLVTGSPARGELTVRVLTQQDIGPERSLELWALPGDGSAPRSLGLIPANGTVTLPLPENAEPGTVSLLAVSLEPKGGSPNPNAPSGPVLFKGAWTATRG